MSGVYVYVYMRDIDAWSRFGSSSRVDTQEEARAGTFFVLVKYKFVSLSSVPLDMRLPGNADSSPVLLLAQPLELLADRSKLLQNISAANTIHSDIKVLGHRNRMPSSKRSYPTYGTS